MPSDDGLLTLNVQGPSNPGLTRSISWLLMLWSLVSPGHQQSWYWCKLGRSLSYMKKDFNYLCHVSVEEWQRLYVHIYVSTEKFSALRVHNWELLNDFFSFLLHNLFTQLQRSIHKHAITLGQNRANAGSIGPVLARLRCVMACLLGRFFWSNKIIQNGLWDLAKYRSTSRLPRTDHGTAKLLPYYHRSREKNK